MLHHFQTLPIIARPRTRIPILGLAVLVEWYLPQPVRAINALEALPLGGHEVLLRVVKPAVDEVAVEAVPVANLGSGQTQ
jgi:hypothetical protein